jgi:cytochrome c553
MAFAAIVTAGTLNKSPRVQAQSSGDSQESRIKRGFEIAPVPLSLEGKDRALVGLGSYLVNAVAACNDCHDAGAAQTQYEPGGNPFFGQRKKINPATYLGGGQDFGPLLPTPGSPHIVSRNLTPDKTGLPEGGRPFSEFLQIMRTGVDLDQVHPPCSSTVTTNCLPPPFDGNLLQIMPWPTFQNLNERDIRAIYEYLSAIPCIEGPPPPSLLHNDCQ